MCFSSWAMNYYCLFEYHNDVPFRYVLPSSESHLECLFLRLLSPVFSLFLCKNCPSLSSLIGWSWLSSFSLFVWFIKEQAPLCFRTNLVLMSLVQHSCLSFLHRPTLRAPPSLSQLLCSPHLSSSFPTTAYIYVWCVFNNWKLRDQGNVSMSKGTFHTSPATWVGLWNPHKSRR